MAKAEPLELLALHCFGLTAQFSPADTIKVARLLTELACAVSTLFPLVVIGDRTFITQEIAVPILASTDATIARFETLDAPFHVVVGVGRKSGRS